MSSVSSLPGVTVPPSPADESPAIVNYISLSGEHIRYADLFTGIGDITFALDAVRDMAFQAGCSEVGGAISLLANEFMRLTPDYEALPPAKEEVERIKAMASGRGGAA